MSKAEREKQEQKEYIKRYKEARKQFRKENLKYLQREFRRQFITHFEPSLNDSLELFIRLPSDDCFQDKCDGWRYWYKNNDLLDMIYDDVQEYFENEYDMNEDQVEKRMDKMTDKKVVKLYGKNHLDSEYPVCPHRNYCEYYE